MIMSKHPARVLAAGLGILGLLPLAARGAGDTTRQTAVQIALTSSAFAAGQAIPAKHTADGADVSPPLRWSGVPATAKSLALVVDDPDAPVGTWTHWVLYGLPPATAELAENLPKTERLANGACQGVNDFRKTGYGGPSPPPGKPHRYFFTLFALDTTLALPPGASRKQLLAAIQGHVLAEGRLMGTYQRAKPR